MFENLTKHKLLFLPLLLGMVILSLFYQKHVQPKVAGIVYDKSIKVTEGEPIKVAQVIDGDTIILANGDHLRYIGMDTPEEFDQRKPLQCFAKEAAEANRELVQGKTITFHKDQTKFDKYGRWLGFVYLQDGTMVNEQLVKNGFAFAYPYAPDISKKDLFAADENSAKIQKLGLWSACTVNVLSTGRKQTNPVQ